MHNFVHNYIFKNAKDSLLFNLYYTRQKSRSLTTTLPTPRVLLMVIWTTAMCLLPRFVAACAAMRPLSSMLQAWRTIKTRRRFTQKLWNWKALTNFNCLVSTKEQSIASALVHYKKKLCSSEQNEDLSSYQVSKI